MLHFSPIKTWSIIAVVILGMLFAAPNMFDKKSLESAPGWLPSNQLNLGLDLRGGSHLLVSMKTEELIKDWLITLQGQVRKKIQEVRVNGKRIRSSRPRVNKDRVEVRISNPEHVAAAETKIRELVTPLSGIIFTGSSATNLEVVKGDQGLITIKPTEQAVGQRVDTAIGSAMETIRRRIDILGTTEPIIQREGKDRILIQVPGFNDPQRLKALIQKTAKLTFQLLDRSMSPEEAQAEGAPIGSELVEHREGGFLLLQEEVLVSGEELKYARPGRNQDDNLPIIEFGFDTGGARKFARVTRDNVGRRFAIILDNGVDDTGKRDRKIVTAPVIQTPILTGQGQISGRFTAAETAELSILLTSGSLAAPLQIIQQSSVGPSLGADSILAGQIASIIGLVGVVIFILMAYGLFGVFANVALFVNLVLILGVLSMLQATLTLPGIAGIVLTIGMAVDANVLIFERIREELRGGKPTVSAIDTGYSRALGTILDANITTFIAAAILFLLGSGPIKGFAVTLSIGIATSVFTAFLLTRLIVATWLKMQKSRNVPAPI